MSKETATIDKEKCLENYNKVVDNAELVAVQLLVSNFNVSPDFFRAEEKNFSYSIEIVDVDYKSKEKAGIAFLLANVKISANANTEDILLFKTKYVVLYNIEKRCDKNAVFAFLQRVAPFTCYPYFRALFASMCGAAGVQVPPLPVHKEKPVQKEKSVQKEK